MSRQSNGLLKQILAYTALILLALFVSEIGARLLGFQPRIYTRPYDPVFVSGEYFGKGVKSSAYRGLPSDPSVYGYQPDLFDVYTFRFRPTGSRRHVERTDFVFDNPLSRYSARDIDRIICNKPDVLTVYVIGGSAAQGVGASRKENAWHALLEKKLRQELRNPNIYVFNAAIGGFNTLQERLTYFLAVSPRKPDIVLDLDGFNDVVLPLNTMVRPGDPYQTGIRYTQFYGSALLQWLFENSALANFVSMRLFFYNRDAVRHLIDKDEAVFVNYERSVVREYMRNTTSIIDDCMMRRRKCLVALQPFRAISHQDAGIPLKKPDVVSTSRLSRIYQSLRETTGADQYSGHYVDLSGVFSRRDRLGVYTDYVHFNDKGNEIIADALLPYVVDLIRSGTPRSDKKKEWCTNPWSLARS